MRVASGDRRCNRGAAAGVEPWLVADDGSTLGWRSADGRVWATTLHGLFESDGFRASVLRRARPGTSRRACPSPPSAPPASTASPTPWRRPSTSTVSSPSSSTPRRRFVERKATSQVAFPPQNQHRRRTPWRETRPVVEPRWARSPSWSPTCGGGPAGRATATSSGRTSRPIPTGWRTKWLPPPPDGAATTPRSSPRSGGRRTPTGWRAPRWPRGWWPGSRPTRRPPAPAWDWPAAGRRRCSSTPTRSWSTTSTTSSTGCSPATSTRSWTPSGPATPPASASCMATRRRAWRPPWAQWERPRVRRTSPQRTSRRRHRRHRPSPPARPGQMDRLGLPAHHLLPLVEDLGRRRQALRGLLPANR